MLLGFVAMWLAGVVWLGEENGIEGIGGKLSGKLSITGVVSTALSFHPKGRGRVTHVTRSSSNQALAILTTRATIGPTATTPTTPFTYRFPLEGSGHQ